MIDQNISKIYWLWFPMILIGIQIVLEVTLPSEILSQLHTENGPHEIIQFLFLVAAFMVSVQTLLTSDFSNCLWLRLWVGIAAICCFYVAGEEISWGQHFLKWGTPEYWVTLNDQGETNFHNTSSWLDQKPRVLLEVGVVIGGLIIPFILKVKPNVLPKQFAIIYPHPVLGVTAGLFLTLKLIDKLEDIDILIFERISEVEELYLFYFVLLYMLILRKRIKCKKESGIA